MRMLLQHLVQCNLKSYSNLEKQHHVISCFKASSQGNKKAFHFRVFTSYLHLNSKSNR